MNKDPYKILDVKYNASLDEIKSNFKKLALLYHPDKNINKSQKEKDENTIKFRDVTIAYGILSDPYKKEKFWRKVNRIIVILNFFLSSKNERINQQRLRRNATKNKR